MLPNATAQAPDLSQWIGATLSQITIYQRSGRVIYPKQFQAAVKAGYIKPAQMLGRQMYYLPDIEAFAAKWGEKAKKGVPA